MIDSYLYWKIAGGTVCIVCLAFLASGLVWGGISYFGAFLAGVAIVILCLYLIRLQNRTNRKVLFFFEAIRNRDAALQYPEMPDRFQNRLHQEMGRITARFRQQQKEMEEKQVYYESILSVLTHETRNLITPICSLSADLLKYQNDYTAEQISSSLEVIHSQSEEMLGFLDSYYRLTHLPEPDKKRVPVGLLFQKLSYLLNAEPASHRIQFKDPDHLILFADENLLVLALVNLLRNALQAIDGQADGRIVVEAGLSASKRPVIKVADNGPGISPELLSAIFTPFFSTKKEGSGIGLCIARRIMRLHGGDLTVYSVPRIITRFTLSFCS